MQGGGVLLNKVRVDSIELMINADILLNNKFLLMQKGKKNYYLIKSESK